MSTELTKTTMDRFKNALMVRQRSLRTLLPGEDGEKRFIIICMSQIRKNPKLALCDPGSFALSCLKMAALNLDPELDEAYLVPYKDIVVLQIGYMGYISLMQRHPDVASVNAEAVKEGDVFDFKYGTGAFLTHKFSLTEDRSKKKLIGAWAMVRLTNGMEIFRVVDKDYVMRRKNASNQRGDSLMWGTYPEEGYAKTAIKVVRKFAPKSPLLAQAINHENAIDAGVPDDQAIDLPEDCYKDIPIIRPGSAKAAPPPTRKEDFEEAKIKATIIEDIMKQRKNFTDEEWEDLQKDFKFDKLSDLSIDGLTALSDEIATGVIE